MTDWPEWAPSACWRRGRPERRGIGACPRPGRSSAGPSRSRPPRRPLARTSTPCSPPVHTVQYSTVQYSATYQHLGAGVVNEEQLCLLAVQGHAHTLLPVLLVWEDVKWYRPQHRPLQLGSENSIFSGYRGRHRRCWGSLRSGTGWPAPSCPPGTRPSDTRGTWAVVYERVAVGRKYPCRSPLWICLLWKVVQSLFHVQLGSN